MVNRGKDGVEPYRHMQMIQQEIKEYGFQEKPNGTFTLDHESGTQSIIFIGREITVSNRGEEDIHLPVSFYALKGLLEDEEIGEKGAPKYRNKF